MKTMDFGKVGDCVINVNGPRSPSDSEWGLYLVFMADPVKKVGQT